MKKYLKKKLKFRPCQLGIELSAFIIRVFNNVKYKKLQVLCDVKYKIIEYWSMLCGAVKSVQWCDICFKMRDTCLNILKRKQEGTYCCREKGEYYIKAHFSWGNIKNRKLCNYCKHSGRRVSLPCTVFTAVTFKVLHSIPNAFRVKVLQLGRNLLMS